MLKKNTMIIILSALIIVMGIGLLIVKENISDNSNENNSDIEQKQNIMEEKTKESFEEEMLDLNNNRDKENTKVKDS